LEISPEAELRLAQVQAEDDASVAIDRLREEAEPDRSGERRPTDFSRQRALESFLGPRLSEPQPELFDERA